MTKPGKLINSIRPFVYYIARFVKKKARENILDLIYTDELRIYLLVDQV